MDKPRILVIIPAFNEEKSIVQVIRDVRSFADADIVVVDDGSSDSTAELALKQGVRVISLPFNLGIGGAMQTGYIFAHENSYEIAVQLDGDGQHDPAYLKSLIAEVLVGSCDMAIGSRFVASSSYKASASRRAGIVFFSWLVYFLTGRLVKDPTSGFRAVNRNLISCFAANYPVDYPEVDVLVRLCKKNFRVKEIPVEMKQRQGGVSSITATRSLYYMVKVSLALLINSMRSGSAS